MPEPWFSDAYAERRHTCQGPEEVPLHTKPQMAADMVKAIWNEGRRPFRSLVADGLSGNSPAFLYAIDACVGGTALVAVPAATRCWLPRPPTTEHTSTSKGAVHAKRGVASHKQKPLTVTALAESWPSAAWYGRTVSEGPTGPIVYAFARKRVTLCKEGLPERTGWLVSKRTLGASPPSASAISHAPVSTPLRLFVW